MVAFVAGCRNADGGFRGRAPCSDLYYTGFALDILAALRGEDPAPASREFLASFGDGRDLDAVHLACLVRAWSRCLRSVEGAERARRAAAGLERFRSADGGYALCPGRPGTEAYMTFLAFAACAAAGTEIPERARAAAGLERASGGANAWTGMPGAGAGGTAATAGAAVVLVAAGRPVSGEVGDWLMRRFVEQGGFEAAPGAGSADLLSTAAALYALEWLGRDLGLIRDPCLDFIESLWKDDGGFGAVADDVQCDCEYTFYALLALGALAGKNA